jgi:hypothetical protein
LSIRSTMSCAGVKAESCKRGQQRQTYAVNSAGVPPVDSPSTSMRCNRANWVRFLYVYQCAHHNTCKARTLCAGRYDVNRGGPTKTTTIR